MASITLISPQLTTIQTKAKKRMSPAEQPKKSLESLHVSSAKSTFTKSSHDSDYPDTVRFSLFGLYQRNKRHGWSPLAYSTKEGWILGAWTWRTFRTHSEVGLFLCEDHELYKAGSALNWTLRCILTQAIYQVGTMEIRFIGRPLAEATLESGFEPVVPSKVRELAKHLGVEIENKARILHEEARQLYFRICGFDQFLIGEFDKRNIDPIWACVLVQREIWTQLGIRHIFDHADYPDRIFTSGALPEFRVSWLRDLNVLRLVVMAERLMTLLQVFGSDPACTISMSFCSATDLRITSSKDIRIDGRGGPGVCISSTADTIVRLLPRSTSEYRAFKVEDGIAREPGMLWCVTRDFSEAYGSESEHSGRVIQLLDMLQDIDNDIDVRLTQTSFGKSSPEERHQ